MGFEGKTKIAFPYFQQTHAAANWSPQKGKSSEVQAKRLIIEKKQYRVKIFRHVDIYSLHHSANPTRLNLALLPKCWILVILYGNMWISSEFRNCRIENR